MKFALLLVGIAGLACLLGVLLPQVPIPMRANPAARSAWLELQREQFGLFTDVMDRWYLFDIFHAPWFYALWGLIIVAVTVCTVSRFRPTARAVHHPQTIVPDRYFATAHHRADFSHPGGAEAVESALRKRRYSVRRTRMDAEAVYLFAERYPWTTYGTFLSHLALLMLLIGGVLTVFGGFARVMVIAETAGAAPVFDRPGPSQLFIEVLDAYRGLDAEGNIVDYYSMLEVRRGTEVISCKTTVNDPCQAFGYRIHQAAWFNDLAKIRIVAPDGRIAFDQPLDFDSQTTSVPYLVFTDRDGRVQYDGPVPQLATDGGTTEQRADDIALSVVETLPRANSPETERGDYLIGWRVLEGDLRVVVSGPDLAPRDLKPTEEVTVGNGTLRYAGATTVPAIRIDDMPGAPDGAIVQMIQSPGGTSLFLNGIEDENVELATGEEYTATNGYTYRFDRQVEASGLDVRRDPGDFFIWVAVAMAMVGLGITFYVPRRRIWVKVTRDRTFLAGIAERTTRLGRELRLMGGELGSPDAVRPEDRQE
ncbi:MAG: cytochrome c biogenesis protein ResB [Dehalococcoidia bacterium]|nr:cytochrome c biogenesis protein ResB [Dehalococcoidia bacterium]